MDYLNLTDKTEINQFIEYITNYPDVVISHKDNGTIRTYNLSTDQVVSIPIELKYDKLIFGKNQTENIVNISFKDDKIYTYYMDGTHEVVDYNLWFLSNPPGRNSKKLLGSQFYKYINHVSNLQYRDILDRHRYDKDLWFPRSHEEGYMMLHGSTYFKGMKLNQVSILSFDIENQEEGVPREELVVLISNTYRDRNGHVTKKLFDYKDYNENAIDMVEDWCTWVRTINPDIITGHNIFIHDLPILNAVTPLKLGRDGSIIEFAERTSRIRKDAQQQYEYNEIHIHGRSIIDSFFLALKYDQLRQLPSYGLKAIEKYFNLVDEKTRIEWDFTLNPVYKTIKDSVLYENFKKYSIDDADGPLKMIDIMLPSYFYFAQTIPQSLQMIINTNTGGQINSFLIRSYLQDGESIPKTTKITEPIAGGISFAVPGVYRNVLKVDIKSCYPSQVLRFKLYDKVKDPKAHFYKMVKYFAEERFELKKMFQTTKDKYYKDRDAVSKIFINSAYGMTITNYLNFNSPEIGKKITAESRAIIDMSLMWASGNGVDYWMRLFKERIGKLEEENE